jgi:glycosyltransferase involved in cell wall biosynthesis
MKIAIVYDAVYPYVKGGAEKRYYEIARRLADRGHEVHWYGQRYWPGDRVKLDGGITYHGVCKARALYTAGGRRSIAQALLFGLASLRLLGRRFDVIDCCGFPYFSLFAARLAVAVRGGRLVSTWHEVWGAAYWRAYLGQLGPAGQWVERTAVRLPHAIVSVSQITATRLEGELRCRASVDVLPNGVDSDLISGGDAPEGGAEILYAGRLCDFKDIELLLAAVALLRTTRPETTCCIVGDGPHRPALESYARDLAIADAVTFTGFLEDERAVYARMRAARVFVLPSQREGFGIVVLEANAAGLPVLVADYPGNAARELIDGSNGEVFPPVAAALAESLAQWLTVDPARATACRLRARGYDWGGVTERYEQMLAVTS